MNCLLQLTDTKAEADIFIHRKETIRSDRDVRYTIRRRDIEAENMSLKIIKLEDTVNRKQCAIRMFNMHQTYDLTVGMAEASTSISQGRLILLNSFIVTY